MRPWAGFRAGRGGPPHCRGTFKSAAPAAAGSGLRLTRQASERRPRRTPCRAASRACSCCSGRCCCRRPWPPPPPPAPRPAGSSRGWGPVARGAAPGAAPLQEPLPARPIPGAASQAGRAAQVLPGPRTGRERRTGEVSPWQGGRHRWAGDPGVDGFSPSQLEPSWRRRQNPLPGESRGGGGGTESREGKET